MQFIEAGASPITLGEGVHQSVPLVLGALGDWASNQSFLLVRLHNVTNIGQRLLREWWLKTRTS